jgi:hypothetical protein
MAAPSPDHMNSDPVRQEIAKHVDQICNLLDGEGSTIVNKFVVVMEAMDSDGGYGIWVAVNEGAMCHQVLGMVEWQAAREREHIAQNERHDH